MRSKFLTQARVLALTVAAAAALAACGGGSDEPTPAKVTQDIGALTVSATNPTAITAFKSVASALVGKSITFGDVVFDETSAAVNPKLPANTTMTFTAVPTTGVPAGVNPLSGFKIENDLYIVTGYIVAGSATYVPTESILKVDANDPALNGSSFKLNETYTFKELSVDFDTTGIPVDNQERDVNVSIKINNKVIEFTVKGVVGADGKFTVNGQDITTLTVTVVTGAA